MSLSPFGRSEFKINRRQQPIPQEATLENFNGGLNVVDNDLRLTTRHSVVETNVHRDLDGTKSVRWGTKFFVDVTGTVTGNIIEIKYFQDKLVVFMDTGQIATINGSGTKTAIWNSTIASALPGSPSGWSSGLTTIDFTEFRNELVVCNGVDKPILISKTHTVTYLQDLGTGSNVNTPVGRYCTTAGNYTIIAGVTASPDVVYISAQGTSGTYPGDPDPNDSLSINIAAYAPQQGGNLRGLSSFRNFLVVHFATSSVVIILGEYEGAVHKPRVLDTIPEHGVVCHRIPVVLNTDIVYADHVGVYKAKRNVFGNALDSMKLARDIQPLFTADVPLDEVDRFKSFSVHNPHENRIMFFLYNGTEYKIYVMTFTEDLKPDKVGWSFFTGWDWTCGTNSVRGRVYFCKGSKVFQYGNGVFTDEDFTGDLFGEYDSTWTTATAYVVGDRVLQSGTVYICTVAHTSDVFADDLENEVWEEYLGELIEYDWEMPWSDINSRMRKKRVSYVGIDTVGTSKFNLQLYIDNIRRDANGDDDPALQMEFVAGSSPGYGGGDQPYGGGRRAADERMWGFPCEFKLLKIRVTGSTNLRLAFVSITFLLTKGTYKR